MIHLLFSLMFETNFVNRYHVLIDIFNCVHKSEHVEKITYANGKGVKRKH